MPNDRDKQDEPGEPPDEQTPAPSGCFYDVEYDQIRRRRKAVSGDEGASNETGAPENLLGLAISGGGIRSAIFALGCLQALAERHILSKLDYLSTVSGGSYIGMFYAALHVPPEQRKDPAAGQDKDHASARAGQCKDALDHASRLRAACDKNDDALDYLRANANYLAPNGGGDYLLTTAITVRNWLAVQFVVCVTMLAVLVSFCIARLLISSVDGNAVERGFAPAEASQANIWWSPLWGVAGILLALALAFHIAFWLTVNFGASRGRPHPQQAYCSICNTGATLRRVLYRTFLIALPAVTLGVVAFACYTTRAWFRLTTEQSGPLSPPAFWVMVSAWFAVALLAWLFAIVKAQWSGWWARSEPLGSKARNVLTNALVRCGPFNVTLVLFLAAVAALVDTIGQSIVMRLDEHALNVVLPSFAGVGSAAFAALKWALANRGRKQNSMTGKLVPVVAFLAALLVLLVTLSFWAFAVHYALNPWFSKPGVTPCSAGELSFARCAASLYPLWWGLGVLILLVIGCGISIGFLNLSSLESLYSARLTRCFLGASNPCRLQNPGLRDVTSLMPGDAIELGTYYSRDSLAPVHLINMTVNNTVAWNGSRILARNSRGFGMCIGPAGIEVGPGILSRTRRSGGFLTLYCRWTMDGSATSVTQVTGDWLKRPESDGPPPVPPTVPRWVNAVESLPVGDWCAISGAAVSTGLGYRTRSSYAFLLGTANIRLGYWWDAGSQPTLAKEFGIAHGFNWIARWVGTQWLLFRELSGVFYGPRDRRWYLTDGGHFENTGAYELIRRRVNSIIVFDNGADPQYEFEDLALLQRRIRIDFGAQMTELSGSDLTKAEERWAHRLGRGLDDKSFCELSQFAKRTDPRFGDECAIAFKVTFTDPKAAPLDVLWIKPVIPSDASYDVRQYAIDSDFPQESTAEQFFDEAQWESHRMLGQHLITQLIR
ncbi:patatin-like phospholipase family protein [Paraburkholderia sp. J12]|uniref:patatin-like phospholipase family protein n=1 Tax=Paraburkholderia sp. J12 TaxID=2805432 RepID=UPI002ABDD791|nr:patatin-like phospholipase family protein [Paraburkholderia sp. J12]